MKTILLVCGLFLAGGCSTTLPRSTFADTAPAFDPIKFWSGHTASWGVIEDGDGTPTAIVTTATAATTEGQGGLHMVQHVVTGGKDTVRDWHIRPLGDGIFEATANDMVGSARGVASGRMFHWTWTWETKPGNPFSHVVMEQWMYLADNDTLMNRTIIRKFGIRLAEVSEQFVRQE